VKHRSATSTIKQLSKEALIALLVFPIEWLQVKFASHTAFIVSKHTKKLMNGGTKIERSEPKKIKEFTERGEEPPRV
jgi:hypothetical protein